MVAPSPCALTGQGSEHVRGRCRPANLVTFLFLLVLAIIGVGITDYSPADAHRYWLFMILIISVIMTLVAIYWERYQAQHR